MEKPDATKQISTGFIVRDKHDPSKQMQIVVNHDECTVGVIMNNGLELLIIETAVLDDVPLIYKNKGE